MKLFEKIFSIINSSDKKYKLITIMGLELKIKRRYIKIDDVEQIADKNRIAIIQGVQRSITTALLHQKTFTEFKNKHFNQEVVLIGAGPTLKYFEPFNDNKFYVGCNRAFMREDIKFDYLFSIDKVGLDNGKETYYDAFFNYRKGDCVKFIGDQNMNEHFQIPESQILKYDVKRYKTTAPYLPNNLSVDIDSSPLANFATVSLQALQFILYTNPSKIYIAGIDCTTGTGKHFTGFDYDASVRNENANRNDDNNIQGYKQIKQFVQMYYPETEIISVNPVGLKGIFKDVYTESYLNEHPEIREELGDDIEILNGNEVVNA